VPEPEVRFEPVTERWAAVQRQFSRLHCPGAMVVSHDFLAVEKGVVVQMYPVVHGWGWIWVVRIYHSSFVVDFGLSSF
jgi:hypothetical protein